MEINVNDALNLAVKMHNSGEIEKAEEIYRKILETENNPDALHLLGLISHQKGNSQEAINLIEKAIELKNEALYFNNLGMIYDSIGKEEESAKSFMKAIEINPSHLNAHLAYYNLGIYFKGKGELIKAIENYNKSIELKPDFPDACWNRSLLLLLLGNFKEGWKDYEYRFKKQSPTDSRNFGKPEWDGSYLNGKTLLVSCEQGFGDSIQFSRYLSLVKEKGAAIILECRKELTSLFKNNFNIEIIEKSKGVPKIDFDFYVHLMSLPRVFKTNLENIPSSIPYLKADKALAEKFSKKFDKSKFNVGICWAGNPEQENDKNRSASLENFQILKQIPQVKLYSLQKGQSFQTDSEIENISSEINDFSDTAAIIENLDLIISVDTCIAHLAGAMGKPVWTLLSHIPDWRWLLERKDSPWYPSIRLFRQDKPGDWNSVFSQVKEELKNLSK